MRARRALAGVLAVAAALTPAGPRLRAASGPPTPSPTPACGPCGGPPPPPNMVPTAALVPTSVPVAHTGGGGGATEPLRRVVLSPQKVERKHPLTVKVTADNGDLMVFTVTYWHHKPVGFKAKLTHGTVYVRRIVIPQWAPLGRASLRVALSKSSHDKSAVSFEVPFTVVK